MWMGNSSSSWISYTYSSTGHELRHVQRKCEKLIPMTHITVQSFTPICFHMPHTGDRSREPCAELWTTWDLWVKGETGQPARHTFNIDPRFNSSYSFSSWQINKSLKKKEKGVNKLYVHLCDLWNKRPKTIQHFQHFKWRSRFLSLSFQIKNVALLNSGFIKTC